MNYRRMGRTGLKISEISIGAWLTYGGTVAGQSTKPIIDSAISEGVNYIDLSDIYSKGEAEKVIGKIIKDYKRSDLVISSKLFWPMSKNVNDRGLSRKHIMESIEGSLKRLGTDYLDLYFCHRFDPETEIEETVRAMDDLVHQGKILYWGTSVWEADQIETAVSESKAFQCYCPVVEQPRYHILDRHIESAIMPACANNGIGLVVWSPLGQGLLTGKYNDGIPKDSRGGNSMWLKPDLTEEKIEIVRKLGELAKSIDLTTSQLALAWILRKEEITCAIVGATKPEHILESVKASGVSLSDDILKEIDNIVGDIATEEIG